jgi:predicted transcriptional regulator of viral defense system
MQARGDIKALRRPAGMYEVTAPFAATGPIDENELLLEVNPYAFLSHFSALAFHGLTDRQANMISMTGPRVLPSDVIPIDTVAADWEDIPLPAWTPRPDAILRTPIRWSTVSAARYNGFLEYQPYGARIRVSTPERTLVDSLQAPDLSGGIANVLRAWAIGGPAARLDQLVAEVERYDVQLLRQRVGFVLERLGLTHPVLDQWQQRSHRGGSSRLVGTEPFSSRFDDRWNLSINASTSALGDGPG